MLPNRLRVSQESSDILKHLKGRTGVTPNILCRIALMLSLRHGKRDAIPAQDLHGLEFNSSTLFGDYAVLYYCAVRQVYGESADKAFEQVVAYHISDGLKRLRTARTVVDLLQSSNMTFAGN